MKKISSIVAVLLLASLCLFAGDPARVAVRMTAAAPGAQYAEVSSPSVAPDGTLNLKFSCAMGSGSLLSNLASKAKAIINKSNGTPYVALVVDFLGTPEVTLLNKSDSVLVPIKDIRSHISFMYAYYTYDIELGPFGDFINYCRELDEWEEEDAKGAIATLMSSLWDVRHDGSLGYSSEYGYSTLDFYDEEFVDVQEDSGAAYFMYVNPGQSKQNSCGKNYILLVPYQRGGTFEVEFAVKPVENSSRSKIAVSFESFYFTDYDESGDILTQVSASTSNRFLLSSDYLFKIDVK